MDALTRTLISLALRLKAEIQTKLDKQQIAYL